jgi:hypothetical protein
LLIVSAWGFELVAVVAFGGAAARVGVRGAESLVKAQNEKVSGFLRVNIVGLGCGGVSQAIFVT